MAYRIPSIAGRNNAQWKHSVERPYPDDMIVDSWADHNDDFMEVASSIDEDDKQRSKSEFTLETTNFPVPPRLGPEDLVHFEQITRWPSNITAYHDYDDGFTTISGKYRTHKRAMIAAEAMSNRLKEGRNPRTGRPTK